MMDAKKTDPKLGQEIHDYLVKCGVETPLLPTRLDAENARGVVEDSFRQIMIALGLNLNDDSLSETPKRVSKMFVNEIYCGLDYFNFPKVTTINNKMAYTTMLLERHIAVKSCCEHHFLPFIGEAYIAYLPNKKVIGLSKINRITEFFSRRPQVQERLTEQVFHTLCYVLDTEDVAVLIKAEHTCVKLRGVEDVNSDTITTRLGGAFIANEKLRNEFMQSLKI